ncbi:IlvN-domain-containing protein [Eremomyces bilateralis CBS 781.70]|uniref:IlvN-domain-containing protein n=1 Tax=Eremomyces bilateralis CBS 781.70 TaxID=1392243 RepID=A0A6G1GF29_9PEZI|nr:IlvN-domain-containing protein [Eremomyces bilateralis CBS 781.70]KAF1816470.1 IlvN-domain-containing protein [Eremomyces bilateralis CBS 781.70]
MSAALYYDSDCSSAPLAGKTIVFVGYGNQGRAQALNLRDTIQSENISPAPRIIVANNKDSYASKAEEDGFGFQTDWAATAAEADILFLLVPDQVQPKLFNESLAPTLKKTACVVVASGYNVFYQFLHVPTSNDIVMVAPRMIGTSVRSRYESNQGFPCFVSVEQDGTGHAKEVALAVCKGVGATKGGVIESSAKEETLMDLFAEQAIWPQVIATFREAYGTLKKLGCSDEALVHELWLSKEPAEVFEKCADDGFISQLRYHSSVSQYGQLKGSMEVDTGALKKEYQRVAEQRILNGAFAKEFMALDTEGPGVDKKLDELYDEVNHSELAEGEARVRARLGLN